MPATPKGEITLRVYKSVPRKSYDYTSAQRQQKRRDKLNAIAQSHGFTGWSAFETALTNEQISVTVKAGMKAAQQSVQRTDFRECSGCEYNPCDLANNADYCPARRLR